MATLCSLVIESIRMACKPFGIFATAAMLTVAVAFLEIKVFIKKNKLNRYDQSRWPNFTLRELSCPCCGEFFLCKKSMDAIQHARDRVARPLIINSAHRCKKHNTLVSGVKNSQHLQMAFDVSIRNFPDKRKLVNALDKSGFLGFGFYRTFIHVDMGSSRYWFENNKVEEFWKNDIRKDF